MQSYCSAQVAQLKFNYRSSVGMPDKNAVMFVDADFEFPIIIDGTSTQHLYKFIFYKDLNHVNLQRERNGAWTSIPLDLLSFQLNNTSETPRYELIARQDLPTQCRCGRADCAKYKEIKASISIQEPPIEERKCTAPSLWTRLAGLVVAKPPAS